jgi:hypothetical protein
MFLEQTICMLICVNYQIMTLLDSNLLIMQSSQLSPSSSSSTFALLYGINVIYYCSISMYLIIVIEDLCWSVSL